MPDQLATEVRGFAWLAGVEYVDQWKGDPTCGRRPCFIARGTLRSFIRPGGERRVIYVWTRDVSSYLVDRYSERKESAEELGKRVNLRAI